MGDCINVSTTRSGQMLTGTLWQALGGGSS